MAEELIRWPPVKGMSLAEPGHPPGGRCPPNICWCTKCPHYKPLTRHKPPATASKPTASTKRMAQSWKDREEPTWIDKQ